VFSQSHVTPTLFELVVLTDYNLESLFLLTLPMQEQHQFPHARILSRYIQPGQRNILVGCLVSGRADGWRTAIGWYVYCRRENVIANVVTLSWSLPILINWNCWRRTADSNGVKNYKRGLQPGKMEASPA
jgi:hypothetical protein